MTITLELSPSAEMQIEESIAQRDAQRLQRLLIEAIPVTVDRLISHHKRRVSAEEFQKLADQLIHDFSSALGKNSPLLSDYAVSREGIYEDHP